MRALVFSGPGSPRLDVFILEQVPGLAPGLLHKWLRQNKIKLNGKKQPLSTRLAPGDEVRLYLPEGFGEAAAPPPAVLYEDDALLAVYKPAGLISQGEETATGKANAPADSLLSRVRAYLGEPGDSGEPSGGFSPALCHRLDTGTSGVVLAAKTPEMLDFVTELLREHRLQKTYHGLCVGRLSPAAGTLVSWLAKDAATGHVRALAREAPGAKYAETAYETLTTSGRLTLVRLRPTTGRTHQLRVQLAATGAPLLGDSKYGTLKINRELRCRYQCLCATGVRFPKGLPAPFERYAGLAITCEMPWFYAQALDGTLA